MIEIAASGTGGVMRDHLIRLGDAAAIAAVAGHAGPGEDGWAFALPQWVSGLAVEAHAVAGVATITDWWGPQIDPRWRKLLLTGKPFKYADVR